MIQWSIRLLKQNDNWTITPLSHISLMLQYYFCSKVSITMKTKNKSFIEENNQSTKEVWLRCMSDHEWHNITGYNFWSCHKNQWENYITLSPYHTTTLNLLLLFPEFVFIWFVWLSLADGFKLFLWFVAVASHALLLSFT